MVMALAAGASGEFIELPLNCAGTYDFNTPAWTSDFDLGVTFSEISHVYIDWSGEITAGLAIRYTDTCNPFPRDVGIKAGFYPPLRTAEVWGGEGTYPVPEPFDVLSQIGGTNWSDLLDGKANIEVEYDEIIMLYGEYIEHGSVVLDEATLIVEGTVVPEPATLTLLGLGGIFLKKTA
jgi:hypothetical protein